MMTVSQVLSATRGELLRGDSTLVISGISTDTRALPQGALYLALKGERFDGHDFAADALDLGAQAVITSRPIEVPGSGAIILVADTLWALGDLARFWRQSLGIKVVAVTGSAGKTSTKEVTAELLGLFMPTAKSPANFNNEVGVPQTLLGVARGVAVAVLEFGMRGSGEIAYLSDIARPDIGIITNVGTAHIGRLGSQEAIARAKGELAVAVANGAMVLNGDDEHCRKIGKSHRNVCYFSVRGPDGAQIWAQTPVSREGNTWRFRAQWHPKSAERAPESTVRLPLPGSHHVANALAALGVAWHLELSIPPDLTLAPPAVSGRSRRLSVGDVEILDETYNANPESVLASLDTFCRLDCSGRFVVVLGAMAELGDYAETAYHKVGGSLDHLRVDLLVTVGEAAEAIANSTRIPVIKCLTNTEAVAALERFLRPGDCLLVKGSRAGRLEEIIVGLAEVFA